MEQIRVDLALLLTLLVFSAAHAAQHVQPSTPAMPPLPPALKDCLSPLSRQQALYYGNLIKRAAGSRAMSESVLYEFCTTARLLCSVSLQQSTWGRAAMGAESTSLSSTPSSKNSSPSRSHSGKSSESEALAGGWASKTREPLPSASKTGTVDHQAAKAALSLLVDWKCCSREGKMEPEGIKRYFKETELVAGTQLLLPSFLYQPTGHNEISRAVKPSFLPASMVLDLPAFDLLHLNDLRQLFHIPSDMEMAQKMEETLKACAKAPSPVKEDSIIISSCATSFEAMLKFASSMLGAPSNRMQALTNSKVVGSEGAKVTILQSKELAAGHDTVDCHELTFPFKVMGCHRIKESKAMVMTVADEKGNNMDLLVACHENTALFNPQHEAFSQLHSSPGHTEICHFLPNSDIVWIPL